LALEEGARPDGLLFADGVAKSALIFPAIGLNQDIIPETKIIKNNNTRFPRRLQVSTSQLESRLAKQSRALKSQGESRILDSMVGSGRFCNDGDLKVAGRISTPQDGPIVGGYDLLKTPQLVAGVNMTPIMTWGQLASTPLLLGGSRGDDTGPEFTIPELPQKDIAAHFLAESAGRKIRARKRQLERSNTPFSNLRISSVLRGATPSPASWLTPTFATVRPK